MVSVSNGNLKVVLVIQGKIHGNRKKGLLHVFKDSSSLILKTNIAV